MANEAVQVGEIVPNLIVRHTSRRLGNLDLCEACGRLVSGSISFSEFVDQVGDGYREILNFMMDHDLHPGRPSDVLFSIDCYAGAEEKDVLIAQLDEIYASERRGKIEQAG